MMVVVVMVGGWDEATRWWWCKIWIYFSSRASAFPSGSRMFVFTYIYICVCVTTYCSRIRVYVAGLVWRHTHRYHPHYASKKREEAEEECQDSFVRPGLEIQGGVLLLFSLHCHTRRQCFVSPIHGGDKLESSGEGWRWNRSEEATLKSEFLKILLARPPTIFPICFLHPGRDDTVSSLQNPFGTKIYICSSIYLLNALSKHNIYEGFLSINLHAKLACSNQSKREDKL